jgi:hypothetical protein
MDGLELESVVEQPQNAATNASSAEGNVRAQ